MVRYSKISYFTGCIEQVKGLCNLFRLHKGIRAVKQQNIQIIRLQPFQTVFYLSLLHIYEHQWYKRLSPGQAFTSVKAAVAAGSSLEETIGALTCYRRKIRRKNRDNAELPIIFNDYMNCLYGDPTTEKLIPLIDAAQQAGCEYFCIDAGWYADGEWWDGVGEWLSLIHI